MAKKAGHPFTYLLGVVDDGLGETTCEDTERSQDRTECVDPHEVEFSLRNEMQERRGPVRTCHG